MKRFVSVLLACCLLMCGVAVAEENTAVALPEVELDLGKKAELWEEQDNETVKGSSYIVDDWYVILACEAGEYTAVELGYELAGEMPEDAVVIDGENGITQRVQAQLTTVDAVIDVSVFQKDGYVVYLFVMAVDEDMETVAAQVDEWLTQLTIDGESALVLPEESSAE